VDLNERSRINSPQVHDQKSSTFTFLLVERSASRISAVFRALRRVVLKGKDDATVDSCAKKSNEGNGESG